MQGEPATSDPQQATTETVYVDLDGTLIASDTLWDSLCLLLAQRPLDALRLPFWLGRGKAALKRQIAERVVPDPALLPYRSEVLALLQQAREQGRRVVLCTASDRRVADSIAEHLGLFDDVLASDGSTNLAGTAKLAAIEAQSPRGSFEYLGNASADLPIWRHAAKAVLVAPTRAAARGASRLEVPSETLSPRAGSLRAALRALRPHQWLKNALLFVPLLLAHELSDLERGLRVLIAFVTFSAVASATYLLNDLLDIEADRAHPNKRRRPFAAGSLSIPTGATLFAGLLTAGFGASAALLGATSTAMLALYFALTTSYTFFLKERMALDVLLLAGLYTHRVLTGAVAADVRISPWLLAFSMFFFLSLALVKRYVELRAAQSRELLKLERRNYEVADVGLVESMGLTSGYLAVLVLCLFVSSDDVRLLYPMPELLWGIALIMLYWITRVWFLARRGDIPDDPVLFAARDRVSYACGLCIAVVVGLAAW